MYKAAQHTGILGLTLVLGSLGSTSDVRAASVCDWLWGRSQPSSEVVVGYGSCPPSACYDPCDPCNACNPCVPVYVCPQPAAVPPALTSPPVMQVQPTPLPSQPSMEYGIAPIMQVPAPARVPVPRAVPRINPIPQTYYRTVWKQVPVTSYRPVLSNDPVTGYPVTVMRPCTTYEWQPERRREGFLRRWFSNLFRREPPVAVSPYCVPVPSYCVPTAMDCCTAGPSSTMGPVPAPMQAAPTPATPYYEPAPPSRQAPPPAGTVPGTRRGTPGSAPGGTPADQPPRLEPGEVPTSQARPQRPASDAMADIPWGGAGQTPAPIGGPGATNPATRPARETGKVQLRPVPDPDAPTTTPPLEAPQLLNPRDRMARQISVPAGAYAPIVWPASVSRPVTRTTPQTHVAPRRAANSSQTWDDSGWRSLRP